MKCLLIDDCRSPESVGADSKNTKVCFHYQQGIEALQQGGPWDILYLDHDLGEEIDKTGYNIVCFLEENPDLIPAKIQIVSSNSVGRQNITRAVEAMQRRYGKPELLPYLAIP
jgi:CheY-like chemotaxis protein